MKRIVACLLVVLSTCATRADVVISNLGWTSTGNVALGDNEIVIENSGGFTPETPIVWKSIAVKLFNSGASAITSFQFDLNGSGNTYSVSGLNIAASTYGLATVDISAANFVAVTEVNSVFQLTNVQATGGNARWAVADEGAQLWSEQAPYSYFYQTLAGGDGAGNIYGQFALEAVAVPEPGTLLMGAFAAVAGFGGYWTRRKKNADMQV